MYKEVNSEDRDCVKYIDVADLRTKHVCIDGKFNVEGACFSMSYKAEVPYSEVKTILSEQEYYALAEPKDIDLQPIIDKILSDENEQLFEEVQQEEKEYLKEEYNLNDDDINILFNNYGLEYRDRGILSTVWDSIDEASEDEAEQLGFVTKENEIYFDYEKFGADMLEEEQYIELTNGKVAYLNY
jgi:hypothetical protein